MDRVSRSMNHTELLKLRSVPEDCLPMELGPSFLQGRISPGNLAYPISHLMANS